MFIIKLLQKRIGWQRGLEMGNDPKRFSVSCKKSFDADPE
jgi:hypothetical protein